MRIRFLVFFRVIFLFSAPCIQPCHGEIRALSTDRPDTTESPYSVDAGRWQIEMEIAAWMLEGGDLASRSYAETNVKYGLCEASDIQVVIPTYSHEIRGDEGLGDIQIRLKRNLWGNEGGDHAFAVMPYLKLPTASGDLGNSDLEGGLIVPFACEGPAGWSIGCMGQVDIVSDEDGKGVLTEVLLSMAMGHDLTDCTAMFVELAGLFSPEGGDEHEAYFNSGFTWMQAEMLQWDMGLRVGLNSASEELTPFLGVSQKF